MAVVSVVLYVLASLAGYLVGKVMPDGPWAPYVPLMVAYHIVLFGLIAYLGISGEQKLGLSMPIVMTVITHIAFLGALIGVVMGRQYVPWFGLLRYVLPGIAPFEATWLFEGRQKTQSNAEIEPMPEGTNEDYNDFLVYMRQKDRRFARPGRSVNDEFVAWTADRAKRRAAELKARA
jgi:hypothetical protein